MCKFWALKKIYDLQSVTTIGLFSEHGESIVKMRVLEMRVLGFSIGLLHRRTIAHEFSYNAAIAKKNHPNTG